MSILGAGSVVCVLKIRIQGVLELLTPRPDTHWLLTTTQIVSRETFDTGSVSYQSGRLEVCGFAL